MEKELVVVLGMHRSGTSVLAKAIIELGYFSGKTLKGDVGNEKGYFEKIEINQLNDQILAEMFLTWKDYDITYINRCKFLLPIFKKKYFDKAVQIIQELFTNSTKCMIKDPRVSILIPFWEEVFNYLGINYKYVLASRNPAEVSNSLVSRGDVNYENGIKLWLYYNTLIIKNIENKAFVVSYSELMANAKEYLESLCQYLSINPTDYETEIDNFANNFIEQGLRHHQKNVAEYGETVSKMYNFIENNAIIDSLLAEKFIAENEQDINTYLGTINDSFDDEYAQIYIDNGLGYSEDNTNKFKLSSGVEQRIIWKLDKAQYVKNLRIDPIVDMGIVVFKSVCVKVDAETIFLQVDAANDFYNNEGIYALPYDGQLYFKNIDKKVVEIIIDICTIPLEPMILSQIELSKKNAYITDIEQELKRKETHFIEIEEVLKASEDYIVNIEREIYNKDVHITNLENIIVDKDVCIENFEDIVDKKDLLIENAEYELQNKNQQNEGLKQNWKNDINVLRNYEERKYIIKYPLRCIKKVGGFFIHPRATIDFYSNKKFLKDTVCFDEQFYIDNSFDYKIHKYNALEHFMRYGWSEGKLPNAQYKHNVNEYIYSQDYIQDKNAYNVIKSSKYFNDNYYKENNPDLPKDMNAVWHFVEYGYKEGRQPSKDFDLDFYIKKNQDVANCGVNPLHHYLTSGYYEGRCRKEGCEDKGAIYNLRVKRYRLKNSQYDMSHQNITRYIKKNGIKKSVEKARQILKNDNNFISIYNYVQPKKTSEVVSELESFEINPKISIIMPVYNVDPKWLDLAIKSIKDQWYENWELCLVDDCSTNQKTIDYLNAINDDKIKVKMLEKNQNISGASNEALTMCTGEYIGLMDNDDEITVDALYEVVKRINDGFTFIYSDEDKLDMSNKYCEPHFKADFSRDLFNSQNYISHFTVIKKELIDDVSGFTVGLEGAQDYDLYLKIFDICKDRVKIAHIPKVLYHWRKIPGSTASEFSEKSYAQDNGLEAVKNSMYRQGIQAEVQSGYLPGTYRIDYDIIGEPLVSIIIPFKDAADLLELSIGSILEKSTYKNFEIIGISNNSEKEETFAEMKRLEALDSRVKFYEYNVPFNYSDINNYAVNNYAKGEYIVLLNNDIEILTDNWIELMLGFAQRENTGAVGAKLYYPNDTVQHAGVIVGLGGVAGHSHKYFSRDDKGYFYRPFLIQNLSAVTAACLMVSTKKYKEIDGLNEVDLKIAFNDVDFCLRLRERGYVNVFTPYVEAYHYESISRGAEDTPEKKARFTGEINYVVERHKDILTKGDPYYNKNLTLDRENFALK